MNWKWKEGSEPEFFNRILLTIQVEDGFKAYIDNVSLTTPPCSTEPDGEEVEEPVEKVWERNHEMECFKIWVNEDNNFEFVFWWEYLNNNHVQIFDMEGNLVWETDFKKGESQFEACLPDGTYAVKTFHEYGHILQEFVIGKP